MQFTCTMLKCTVCMQGVSALLTYTYLLKKMLILNCFIFVMSHGRAAYTAPSFFIWMCVSRCKCHWVQLVYDWRHSASLLWLERSYPLHSAWIPPGHWHSACALLCVCVYVSVCACMHVCVCLCVSECLCPLLTLLIRVDCLWPRYSKVTCG